MTGARRRFRRPVPTVLQMEATECGAASLAMVLAYHGNHQPLEQVRIACGVSRDGATAGNVVRAARQYGLQTRAFKREPAQLADLGFPLIAHWRFAHFLVVEGWFPGGWYLNDPAMGPRQCDDDEFDRSFTGVVIEATPGPDFRAVGRRPPLVRRLAAAAGTIGPLVIFAAAIALLLVVPTLIVPSVVQRYGNGLAGAAGIASSAALVGLTVAAVLQSLLLWLQGSTAVRLTGKISVRLGAQMTYRLLRLPAAYHAQRGASALAQRAVLADQLSHSVSALAVTASTGLLTAAVACAVLLAVDVAAGGVAVAVTVVIAITMRYAIRRSRDVASRVVRESVEVGAIMSSSLGQIEAIKASGTEDGVIARGLAAENRLLDASQRIGVRTLGISVVAGLVTSLGTILIAGTAAWRIAVGALTPGAFLAVLALAAVAVGPLAQVVAAFDQAQTLGPTLDQVDDVLATPEDPEVVRAPPPDAPPTLAGDLDLRAVTFGYTPGAEPTIRDLDLHIAPGRRIALVGPSGCGKSTVSRLVTGLYEPWAGDVLIDGRPRAAHARQVLTDRVALVDQDVVVFAGSIRDNVTLWDPSVPERDVLAALQDAQLADLVESRPGGLDATVAEGGVDLSGGQRQRLEIARALARNPAVLVLDEATSALDPLTEQAIDVAIRRRGISVLVIAHRLSTIRDSDQIVVLHDGTVVERGTHEDLMARSGPYAALVSSA